MEKIRKIGGISRGVVWGAWRGARPLLARLTPFLVALAFVVLYCGPGFPKAWECLVLSPLRLASGPEVAPEGGAASRSVFTAFDLGKQIAGTLNEHCHARPAWWSLDFWVAPDASDRLAVTNVSSKGTEDGLRRLFLNPKDSIGGHVELAIVTDGLIMNKELNDLNRAEPDKIMAIAPLYRSVLCVFTRRDSHFRELNDIEGKRVGIYLGQTGSGARYLAEKIMKLYGLEKGKDYRDLDEGKPPEQVARAMIEGAGSDDRPDIAFILDKAESKVIRLFVDSGGNQGDIGQKDKGFDLLAVDSIYDLFHAEGSLGDSKTIRRKKFAKDDLSTRSNVPGGEVKTIEFQTILASSQDLLACHAFQVARTLAEHGKELGLGADAISAVPQEDPASVFDYPIHEGAKRYYRHDKADSFPYATLVVAIAASIALVNHWGSVAMKGRADRVIAGILAGPHDPERIARVRSKAVRLFVTAKINREGLDRITNTINHVVEAREAAQAPSKVHVAA